MGTRRVASGASNYNHAGKQRSLSEGLLLISPHPPGGAWMAMPLNNQKFLISTISRVLAPREITNSLSGDEFAALSHHGHLFPRHVCSAFGATLLLVQKCPPCLRTGVHDGSGLYRRSEGASFPSCRLRQPCGGLYKYPAFPAEYRPIEAKLLPQRPVAPMIFCESLQCVKD
jgi:hypothetical protein